MVQGSPRRLVKSLLSPGPNGGFRPVDAGGPRRYRETSAGCQSRTQVVPRNAPPCFAIGKAGLFSLEREPIRTYDRRVIMRKELPKTYEPGQVESKIYQAWLDAKFEGGRHERRVKMLMEIESR